MPPKQSLLKVVGIAQAFDDSLEQQGASPALSERRFAQKTQRRWQAQVRRRVMKPLAKSFDTGLEAEKWPLDLQAQVDASERRWTG